MRLHNAMRLTKFMEWNKEIRRSNKSSRIDLNDHLQCFCLLFIWLENYQYLFIVVIWCHLYYIFFKHIWYLAISRWPPHHTSSPVYSYKYIYHHYLIRILIPKAKNNLFNASLCTHFNYFISVNLYGIEIKLDFLSHLFSFFFIFFRVDRTEYLRTHSYWHTFLAKKSDKFNTN